MSTQQDPVIVSVPAGSDLSTKRYHLMKLSSGKLATATAGAAVVGVLTDKPDADGEPGALQIGGIALVRAGGTCTKDLPAASDASGKAVNASGSDRTFGVFLDTGGSGDDVRVILGAIATAQAADSETLDEAGALNPDVPTTLLDLPTGAAALTLAAGTHVGQRKYVEVIAITGSPVATLTLADAYGTEPTTHVFTAVGQRLELEWRSTGWKVIGKKRAGSQTVVVGTDVLTGYDMAATYNLSVTGTVTSDGTKGIPDGLVEGEEIDVQVTTAATCPVGVINITAEDADATAKKDIASIDGTTSHNAHFRWSSVKWRNTSLTGVTLTNA
jgi:hypothetical protein